MQIGNDGADILVILPQAIERFLRGADDAHAHPRNPGKRDFKRIDTGIRILHDEDCAFNKNLRQEAVSHAVHCEKMLRRARIGLQFLPEPDNVRVHRSRIRKRFVAPHGI